MGIKHFFHAIIRDAFVIGLTTFVVFFFLDLAKPGFVTNYINLNALLLFVIGAGIVTILLQDATLEQ